MSKKNHNPNRTGFLNHVDTIKHMEADKDQFLKASRLERHESRREPLTPKHILMCVAMLCFTSIMLAAFVLAYMSGNIMPAVGFSVILLILAGGIVAMLSC